MNQPMRDRKKVLKPARLPFPFGFALAVQALTACAITFTADTLIDGGNTSFEGQAVVVSGCTVTVDGAHAFASLVLTNNGWIRHSDPPSNRIDLTISGDLIVASNCALYGNAHIVVQGDTRVANGGYLFANARGYPIGTNGGPGAGGINPWSYGGGAGHGGPGGDGNTTAGPARGGGTYGHFMEPSDLGSKGGGAGGRGGGAIRLEVGGTLSVDGVLAANGENAVVYWSSGGGGSGGSLWITAGTLAGAGVISADGGDGDVFGGVGGGGGGGRVALYCSTWGFTGACRAWAGGGASYGGPGTVFVRKAGQPFGELVISAGGRSGTPVFLSTTNSLRLTIGDGASVIPDGPLAVPELRVDAGGTVTHLPGKGEVSITVTGDAWIAAEGKITADACGYSTSTNAGPGAGLSGGGGAGHGGNGGAKYSGAKGGSAYGSILWPTNYGSRGGDSTYAAGGAGGGTIALDVAGTFTLDGRLSADGGAVGTESASGSGAGGSIRVKARTLAGTGAISASGGVGDSSYWYGGGGGAGGRIALLLESNSFAGLVTAQGGAGKQPGSAGTCFTKVGRDTLGTVWVDNGMVASTYDPTARTSTPIFASEPFHLVVSNSTTVVFPQPATLASLWVGSNGCITMPSNGVALDLVVLKNATIMAGGQILADGFGYPIEEDPGPGAGVIINHGGSGAGHGGTGGSGWTGAKGGRTYGNATEPLAFGSQGGPSLEGPGGSGGGVVRMTVGGTLALEGRLSANGGSASANNAGGGSGGSVHLTVGELSGRGVLSATGGGGESLEGGGGGGGRIAVSSSQAGLDTNRFLVNGGIGYERGNGGSSVLTPHVPPRVVEQRPTGYTIHAPDHFEIDFDQGVNPDSLTAAQVQVSGPTGSVPTEQIQVVPMGGRTWRVCFPPQTSNGRMTFTVASGAQNLFGQEMSARYAGAFDIRLERYLLANRNGDGLRLDWATSLGHSYQLQATTNLTDWTDLEPRWSGTGGMIGTDVPAGAPGRQFFRLRISE